MHLVKVHTPRLVPERRRATSIGYVGRIRSVLPDLKAPTVRSRLHLRGERHDRGESVSEGVADFGRVRYVLKTEIAGCRTEQQSRRACRQCRRWLHDMAASLIRFPRASTTWVDGWGDSGNLLRCEMACVLVWREMSRWQLVSLSLHDQES